MKITVDQPELESFITDAVRTGRFASADDVVAAALAQLIADDADDEAEEFDDETLAALEESFEQVAKGQTMTVAEAAARLGVSVPISRERHGAA